MVLGLMEVIVVMFQVMVEVMMIINGYGGGGSTGGWESEELMVLFCSIPSLSKDAARQAFVKYVSDKCFFGSRPAENGLITNMEAFNTYRYCLETFTETRKTQVNRLPYYGEPIDTSDQTPPEPWDIPVDVPAFFNDGEQILEIPHTSSVKRQCYGCGGCGVHRTASNTRTCILCGGGGRMRCLGCSGSGKTRCGKCLGKRKIVVSLSVIVRWTTNKEEYTVDQSSGLMMGKLDEVPGKELFTDSDIMVHPVVSFPDPPVVATSERLVREHQAKYSQTSNILQQRQTIELLPITKVTYEWRGKPHVFFVYGTDLKVSAVDYPAACCCCSCTVM
uniref:protein SSUH2 homolog n=1 Tax=Centroberyx gerrardi TaxID=166262 RepID=UPI003AAADD65